MLSLLEPVLLWLVRLLPEYDWEGPDVTAAAQYAQYFAQYIDMEYVREWLPKLIMVELRLWGVRLVIMVLELIPGM